MKRLFLGMLSAALMFSLIACNAGGKNPSKKADGTTQSVVNESGKDGKDAASGKVVMWAFPLSGDDEAMFKPILDSFNEKYPDIKVDIQHLPWNGRYEKMLTAIAGNDAPNVVYLNDFQIPLFASTDNLVPVEEYMDLDKFNNTYLKSAIDVSTYEGTIYAVPILQNSMGYLYNVDLFNKAGIDTNNPPETWQEIEEALKKLTILDDSGNPSQIGGVLDLNRPSPITSIMNYVWQAGGDILDENRNVTVDTPEFAEALNYVKGLYDKGYILKSNITGGGVKFSSGTVGIKFDVEPSEVALTKKENPDLNFAAGPILKGKNKVGYVTVGTYAMFKKSDNHKAAGLWLEYLAEKDNNEHILSSAGFFSPRKDINSSDYLKDERLIYMANQSEWATGHGPMVTQYAEILNILDAEFNSIIIGEKTVEDGLKTAQSRIETIFN